MHKNQTPQSPQAHNKSSQIREVVTTEHFSGPLPHPDILAKYNAIVPDAAERILKKFEAQSEHRQKLEKVVVWTDSIKSLAGLVFGFIIAIITIVGGIYTALRAHPFLGGSLTFVGLAILVGAFVSNKYFPEKQSDEQTKNDKDN